VSPAHTESRAADVIGTLRCTILFTASYLACCIIGQSLSFPGEVPFATFWPASGLSVAVLTLADRRDWPRLIGGAVVANLIFNLGILGQPVTLSLLYCAANMAEAMIGGGLMRGMRRRLDPSSQLQAYMGLAAAGVICTGCGAGIAMLATALAGASFDARWGFIWWAADLAGILLVGPVVLSWWSPSLKSNGIFRAPWRLLELTVLLGLLLARTWTASGIDEYSVRALPVGVMPLLVWAALRFGVRGVSLALVTFFAVQVHATINGRGLFALGHDPIELQILFLQVSAGSLGFSFVSLAAVIEDRNRALEDARQSRSAAERANAAKSHFLANMSHELRTPMNGILGMLGIVLNSEMTSGQRDRLGLVRRSAESLLTLLNDILDLSKVEAGRLELRPEDFSLRDSLNEVLRLVEPQIQEKGVALICHVSPDVPHWLRADKGRLRQVLLNLLGNAVKFTREGRICVEVDVASRADSLRMLHFCVSDTGIGISPDVQERLFSRFEQGHEDGSYGGTGLGLSIARQLVALMGGRMWLESERGQGSRFHFTIAATSVESAGGNDDLPDDTVSRAAGDDATVTSSPLANPSRAILLVEDDPISAVVASTILENAGFKVAIASHGAEAIELWRSQQFSCVLSDMRMPVMNGLELARIIRRHEEQQGPRTPIIILTASGRPGEDAECEAIGVDAYLTKPLRSDELLGAMRQLRIEVPDSAGER